MDDITREELGQIRDRLEAKVEQFALYVHPIFVVKGWTYFDGLPSPSRLEQVCYGLIDELEPGHTDFAARTGRIEAFYSRRSDGFVDYGLEIKDSEFVETDRF